MMVEKLEAAQSEQRNEVADMQTIGSRIEPAIKRDGSCAQSLFQFHLVSAIGNQAPPFQFIVNIHLRAAWLNHRFKQPDDANSQGGERIAGDQSAPNQ